jgi:AICAR transformylase/IMP cyclohydrolase PurH
MKLFVVICILSTVSTIYGTSRVILSVAQISHILRQIPRDKNMPIEMRVKFGMNAYNNMIKYNALLENEILKKREQEKKRKAEEKLKEFLKKIHFQMKKPKPFLPFLRF